MGVWEELIEKGLYRKKNVSKSDMIEFHNDLLENKLPYYTIHLGWESNPFTKNKAKNNGYKRTK